MKTYAYLTALLVAASVGRAGSDRLMAAPAKAAARPAAAKATKSTKSVQGTTTAADVATAANTFYNMLTTAEQSTVQVSYTAANAIKWSNLPCGLSCREGLQFTNLTPAKVAAALAVVKAATGTVADDGYSETQEIRAADDQLGTQRNGYSAGIYFIAFVGAPSATGTWQLQYGGHHLATNITFGNGAVTGATPKFEGVEPLTVTVAANAAYGIDAGTYTPMANEASTMLAMLNGLSAAHKTSAKLANTFSDVVLGPGSDGKFPATKLGVPCSSLTTAEQALVVAAMRPWVQDADDATAAFLMGKYTDQLAGTYISYSGTGLFTTNGDYARIDGPNVWIEFVCQTGVVYTSQTHYHSIWRDHARDYGGNFSGYITLLGTKEAAAAAVFSIYPNPTSSGYSWQLQLAAPASSATYTLRSILGQKVATQTFQGSSATIPTASLIPGTYLLSVETPDQPTVTRRVQVE